MKDVIRYTRPDGAQVELWEEPCRVQLADGVMCKFVTGDARVTWPDRRTSVYIRGSGCTTRRDLAAARKWADTVVSP